MSAQLTPAETELLENQEFLRTQWAEHLKNSRRQRQKEKDKVVEEIVAKFPQDVGGDHGITGEKDINTLYMRIRQNTDPDAVLVSIADDFYAFVDEFGLYDDLDDLEKQKAFVKTTNSRYDTHYKKFSDIGGEYCLQSKPGDHDFIVRGYARHLREYFETIDELRAGRLVVEAELTKYFGNVKNLQDIENWYSSHQGEHDPEQRLQTGEERQIALLNFGTKSRSQG